jgi:formylglycine-generating enzyme required for sulfatase activity
MQKVAVVESIIVTLALTACAPVASEPLPTLIPTVPLIVPVTGAGDASAIEPATPVPVTPSALIPSPDPKRPTDTPEPTNTPLIAPPPTATPYIPLAPLIYHPAGEFIMGSPPGTDANALDSEKPSHPVAVRAFWMEMYEVSNARFALCVGKGACAEPADVKSRTRSDYYTNPNYADFPVINVTWDQARRFCEWAGGRLPTEAEWEYAARFNDGRRFPWGNDEDRGRGNFQRGEGSDTERIDSYLGTATALGVVNMAGNVWEWVADWYGETYYKDSPLQNPTGPEAGDERVLRGGAFATDIQFVRAANRFSRDPAKGYTNVGFRCVADNPPANAQRLPTLTPIP